MTKYFELFKYYNKKVFQQKKITKHGFFYNYDKNNYQQQA